MRRITLFLFVFLVAALVAASPLKIVNVSAPAINCKFDPSCKITVTDTVANFTLPGATGNAFLQSRTSPPGKPGTVGAGKYEYDYRLDLTHLTGLTAAPCVRQLKITFGPVVSLDYDGDGTTEQVFVVTAGGLGTVAPSSADKTGNVVTFNFQTPVCSGSSPGHGQTSYFFGLASSQPARAVTATVVPTLGGPLSLNARAPRIRAHRP
ncbi:MAG: hypothetical protein ACJ76N_11160 [Thermoanaerobaculia bacterium]